MRRISREGVKATTLTFFVLLGGCASTQQHQQYRIDFLPETVESTSREVSVHDLLSLRDIGGYHGELSVSPDGMLVAVQLQQAMVKDDTYRTEWFVIDIASPNQPIPAGEGGEPILFGEDSGYINGSRVVQKARWSPNGRWFAYRLKRGDKIQLWRSSADGQTQEQLTDNDGNVGDFVWSHDSRYIYYRVGSSRTERAAALQVEGENGYLFDGRFVPYISSKPLFEDASQALNPFFMDHTKSLWTVEVSSGSEREATDGESEIYDVLTAVNPPKDVAAGREIHKSVVAHDGKQFAWLENEDPKTFAGPVPPLTLYAQSVDANLQRCSVPECHGLLDWVLWTMSAEEVIFSRRSGFNDIERVIYAWRPGASDVRTIFRTEDLVDKCEISVHGLICIHESSTTPRKVIRIDPNNGDVTTVVDPNPEFRHIDFSRVETLKWKEEGGAEAHGHLVYPSNYEVGRRYPLVIVQYRSRGFLRGGTGDEYPIHPLATHGFFVLSFDRPDPDNAALARNADRFEREREEWHQFRERKRILSALEVVVEELDGRELIDSNNIGLTGFSDGAETVWYALIHSEKFAAVATSSGGYSQNMYYLFSASSRKKAFAFASGLPAPETGDDSRWKEVVVDFHVDRIDTPILVQVSDQELLWSTSNFGSLMDAGKPIEVYVFPEAYHLKVSPKQRLAVYNRNIDWLNFWLRGVADRNPAKAAQYKRWRALCEQHVANLQRSEDAKVQRRAGDQRCVGDVAANGDGVLPRRTGADD